MILYGIPTCDTCKKARKELETAGYDVNFRDVRSNPLSEAEWASLIKEFEDIGTWCNKSNARVYFMNLIFYNYFSGLVTTKSIVSNQIMITRKAASDMVDSAIELGIIEYYSEKEFRATDRYIEYFLSYTRLVAKTYIPKLTKLVTQLHAINNVPDAKEKFKIRR